MDKKYSYIIKRLVITLLLICGVVWGVKLTFMPYNQSSWWQPYDYKERTMDFSTHSVPANYDVVTFRWNHESPRRFLVYKNRLTGQYFILAKLPEFSKINLEEVAFNKELFKEPGKSEWFSIDGEKIKIAYYFPIPWRTDFENSGQDIIANGFEVARTEKTKMKETNIVSAYGKFKQLTLTKKSDNFFRFVPVVIDFVSQGYGGFSVIKDNATGDVLIGIGYSQSKSKFNKEEFSKIIESILFDSNPEPPPFDFLDESKKVKFSTN